MEEFRLNEASLTIEGFHIAFRRFLANPSSPAHEPTEDEAGQVPVVAQPARPLDPPKPAGTPIASPMTGIFYASPSPSSPPFVRVGETVSAGQTVALIEAMKVFNEIPSPMSGTVLEFKAEPGSVVQHGDVLLYIG